MGEVTTIGLDIAKQVFHVHGADGSGAALFSRKLTRGKLLGYFATQPRCLVAMEACGSSHHWGRELQRMGHEVRLIPPAYVKPFVKRQKNDARDAEAICEAAQRPTMRFVTVKSEAQQASAAVFRARDLLVRQRTQLINALRGLLAEYGLVAPQGRARVAQLIADLEDPACTLPEAARGTFLVLVDTIRSLDTRIDGFEREIAQRAKQDDDARRLVTIPSVGPVIATAVLALAPPAQSFGRGRDFAAWMGLTPRQRSTGGKEQLGKITKAGERTLRRLLIIGAAAVVRHASKNGAPEGSWLARMLERKPRMLVTVALANKTARIIWALLAKGGVYKAPAVAA
ncbi:IS110 family transposase [Sphingosinicella terrae]|uniref:IS110 family transposase n=1 Tax=Sphingosinicella terrae TaxID=2172047 RepID=UPI000E0DF1A0|nr:IS110 family transposase [Sphingosinicella terrae]